MINELKPLLAVSRQRVKPKLAKFLQWIESQRIEGGPGIKILRTEMGTIISSSLRSTSFIGAFKVTYANGSAKVDTGFVNGIQPANNDDRITINTKKRTWILVEVNVNDKGKIEAEKDADGKKINNDGDNGIRLLSAETTKSGKSTKGWHPLAMIESEKVYQLSYFSLNHSYFNGRHFFVPA